MSVLARLRGLFSTSDDEDISGLEALQQALADRQASLQLTGVYQEPTIDYQGEPTALFPIAVYHDGDRYGTHMKEFAIPDDGLQDSESPLVRFLEAHGIFGIEDLGSIEGQTADISRDDNGDTVAT